MVAKNERMSSFNWCLVFFLALISVVAFGIDLYFNYTFTNGRQYANQTPRDVSDRYMTQITPASWVFSIWSVIYGLLVIWYIYVFYLLLCRQSRNNLPLFPGIFWLLFTAVHSLNALWLYFYLHNSMIISGVILIVITLVLYLMNAIAFRVCWFDVVRSNKRNTQDIESNDEDLVELSQCEIILLRLLTLNGLPMYATWCTIATCLQWTSLFKYTIFHWSDNVSCIVSLSLLSALLLIYWNMDLLTKREYFVWTWFSCFTLVVAFTAIIDRNNSFGGPRKPGLFFAFILLIISVFVIVLKAFTLCLCPPRYYNPRFSRV